MRRESEKEGSEQQRYAAPERFTVSKVLTDTEHEHGTNQPSEGVSNRGARKLLMGSLTE